MKYSAEELSGYVSELQSDVSEGPPFSVSGVALGPNETTVGLSGDKKFWPPSTLKEAASSLSGKNLVVHHENTVYSVVGEVTDSYYKEGVGVRFKAELDDKEVAERVSNGRLDVSARIMHRDTENLKQNENGAYVIDVAKFDNLSFVLKPGASKSNSVQMESTV